MGKKNAVVTQVKPENKVDVANLIKQGKRNKDIASILHTSTRTIAFHRENIRKKIGIQGQKTNLRSYLKAI